MKFRLCLFVTLLAFGVSPMVVAQQIYQPATGVPVVSPQQANHQMVGYNAPMGVQPGILGCDVNGACDSSGACDSKGCGVGAGCGLLSSCCGHLYDPCCPNVYLSFYGGWSDFETAGNYALQWDSTIDIFDANDSLGYGAHEEFGIGFAAGRTLGRRFRTEIDFTWRRGQANSFLNAVAQPGGEFAAEGKIDVYSLMPNLLLDLNPNGLINVYGGMGGGIAFTNIDVTSVDLGPQQIEFGGLDLNQSSFAYQGILGASVRLSHRAEVFFEYRYFRTDDMDAGALAGDIGFAALDVDSLRFNTGEFISHDYFLGVRVNRW